MADVTPQKRTLPARERRESAAKRRASSPVQPPLPPPPPPPTSTPAVRKPSATTSTTTSTPTSGRKTGYIRGPYKKRASQVQLQTPTTASRSSPSIPLSEDVLPARILGDKPLPTTKQKQPANLSLDEYQSIAESAILSASLLQSRMQWLYQGVFEKYWVKPVKKKGVEIKPPDNPDIKSMQRLGSATMIIEPHTFDVVFFTVKDPAAPPAYQRHPNQHTSKQMGRPSQPAPYSNYPPQTPNQQTLPAPTNPPPRPPPVSLPPQQIPPLAKPAPIQTPPPPPPTSSAQNGPVADQVKREGNVQDEPTVRPPSQASVPAPVPTPTPAPPESQPQTPQPSQRPNPPPPPPPPPPARGSTQDPVIQMLAARAASDPQLKELMKIVATSRASPEQLKEFQSHIDEFNEVIRRQEAERTAKSEERPPIQTTSSQTATSSSQPQMVTEPKPPTPVLPAPPPAQAPAQASGSSNSTGQTRQQPAPTPVRPSGPLGPGPGSSPGMVHPFPHAANAAGRGSPMTGYVGYPPQPLARPEPLIKHIVMEITSVPTAGVAACPDRWLFPEYAVLEMRPGGLEMICSFLVERKGSKMMGGGGAELAGEDGENKGAKWKADQEYYQPVSMTIKALNHKTIETIAKAAKTLPAVQEYMKKVMSTKERAPVEYLVHQLPREGSHVGSDNAATAGFVDSGVELDSNAASEEDELKEWYGT